MTDQKRQNAERLIERSERGERGLQEALAASLAQALKHIDTLENTGDNRMPDWMADEVIGDGQNHG